MNPGAPTRPSFSTAGRWRIGLDVLIRTLIVIAVAGMVNYLATQFYHRFYLSAANRVELSSRTLAVLHSLTNRVDITLYYDTRDTRNFYPTVLALLQEYQSRNPKISLRTVDYERDAGAALKVKDQYNQFFGAQSDKDLVIFDCGGRVRVFPGAALLDYKDKFVGVQPKPGNPQQKEIEFEREPVQFNGEQAFTSVLLALENPQPLNAYFLQGHGEPSLTDSGNIGFQKFVSVLAENYVSVTNLWLGAGGVPMNCNLLVIAGPATPLDALELQEIGQYLHEGGRLLMLFNYASRGHPTGIESLLQPWGVNVMDDIALDPDHTVSTRDIVVNTYGRHPVVDSLAQVKLQIYLPRPILKAVGDPPSANAPDVSELFATSPGGTLAGNPNEPPHTYPLACAVEQKPVAGVNPPRGNTRMVVVGDDIFLGNYYMEADGNRDFLNSAVNWLCDRPILLNGIGPRPVTNFRLEMTRHQERQLGWLLLGALPGVILFAGWLVFLVRRR
jgi:hypothetical protein